MTNIVEVTVVRETTPTNLQKALNRIVEDNNVNNQGTIIGPVTFTEKHNLYVVIVQTTDPSKTDKSNNNKTNLFPQ